MDFYGIYIYFAIVLANVILDSCLCDFKIILYGLSKANIAL